MVELPPLFRAWFCLAVVCCALMWLSPGAETIPLHVGWVGLCLSYGFALWPPRITVLAILGYAAASGVVLVVRARSGVLDWGETAEIPLMALMALVMAWHVARRVEAGEEVGAMAAAAHDRHLQRERLARMYSHEMRNPLTIARGYVGLLRDTGLTHEQQDDLAVVDDELGTLERVSDRLLRMLAVADPPERRPTDVDELLAEVARRWGAVYDRTWVVDARAGWLECSRDRVRMCLDTLVENALRYTDELAVIRLFGEASAEHLSIGVADSGPGLPADLVVDINQGTSLDDGASALAPDTKRQTGLGLALVRQVAESNDGVLKAGRAPEGGAWVAMVLPRPARPGPVRPAPAAVVQQD